MTLIQLRYFLAIVRSGSMTAAGAHVGVAQAALSQQIALLEEELGQRLFRRHARGMSLTPAGERLRERAIEILRQVQAVNDEFASSVKSPVGSVAVGLATAMTMAISVELLKIVKTRYPRIRLQLIESMSGFLLEWVERGRIDLAVVYDLGRAPSFLGETLGQEELFLITAPDAARRFEHRVTFREVAALPMIVPGFPHRLRMLLDQRLAEQAVTLSVKAEVDSTFTIKKLVMDGFGYSILSLHAVQEEVERGDLMALGMEPPGIVRTIDLAFSPQRRTDPAVSAVRSVMSELIRVMTRPPLVLRGDVSGLCPGPAPHGFGPMQAFGLG